MFGIGWPEFLLIAVVALMVIGPKDIPKALHSLGKAVRKLRVMSKSITDGFDDLTRDAELDDIVNQANSIVLDDDLQILSEHQVAKEKQKKIIDEIN